MTSIELAEAVVINFWAIFRHTAAKAMIGRKILCLTTISGALLNAEYGTWFMEESDSDFELYEIYGMRFCPLMTWLVSFLILRGDMEGPLLLEQPFLILRARLNIFNYLKILLLLLLFSKMNFCYGVLCNILDFCLINIY